MMNETVLKQKLEQSLAYWTAVAIATVDTAFEHKASRKMDRERLMGIAEKMLFDLFAATCPLLPPDEKGVRTRVFSKSYISCFTRLLRVKQEWTPDSVNVPAGCQDPQVRSDALPDRVLWADVDLYLTQG